ncbi:MAG: hypothetical protein ACPLRH_03500 [Desulfotomaculales bacterium]
MADHDLFLEIMADQIEWLKSCQVYSPGNRAHGVLCLDPGKNRAVPYFSNFAALALLEDPSAYAFVERYLDWYILNLEENGTMRDYYFEEDLRVKTGRPDSEDAYAGTFLFLVGSYLKKTSRASWFTVNLARLKKIARAITSLQCRDGLTFARADHRVKYLMDNCEAYRGLSDFAELLAGIGDPEAQFFRLRAEMIASGIERELWDSRRMFYRPQKKCFFRFRTRWHVFYPDAVCQVFPVLYGLVAPESARGIRLYKELNVHHPDLVCRRPPDYPWMLLGYCACLCNDFSRARAKALFSREAYVLPRSDFWYCLEAAYLVLTCALLLAGT